MRNSAQGVITSIPLTLPKLDQQQLIAAKLKAQLAEADKARQAAQTQLVELNRLKTRALRSIFSHVDNQQPISTVAKLQSGYAFKSETFKCKGVRLLRNANILPGKVYWDDAVYLSEADAKEHPNFVLRDGDVLISLDRPIISSGIKVARVKAQDLPALLVQRVGRFFIIPNKLDADYLYAYLQTDLFIDAISGHEQSVGVPHISQSQVESIHMPLPDLATQKVLAEKAATIMAEWQKAHTALQAQLKDLAILPQRILAQAFGEAQT